MDISIGSPGRLVPLKVIGSLIGRLIPHIGNSSICAFQDNDANVKNAKWDWFNARNYCRKRCMDLVSIETKAESDWINQQLNGEYLL